MDRKDKHMNLLKINDIKPLRKNLRKPSPDLTDKEWQSEFEIIKLYTTPYKCRNRMGGRYSRESGKEYFDKEYDGISNYQSYCSFINSILKVIRNGEIDYCFFKYQICDLLKFHPNLKTKYRDGYFEVWLD